MFLTVQNVLIIVVSALTIGLLYAFMKFTFLGKALRAVAQDRETAGLMGINPNQLIMLTFVIASALAGMGGAMLGPVLVLTPFAGTSVIVKGLRDRDHRRLRQRRGHDHRRSAGRLDRELHHSVPRSRAHRYRRVCALAADARCPPDRASSPRGAKRMSSTRLPDRRSEQCPARSSSRHLVCLSRIAMIAALPMLFQDSYWRTNLIVCAINVMLAIGLDFILGYAGQLNLGHSAFYGIGAYASTLLIMKLGLPFWIAFLLACSCRASPGGCCRFLQCACAAIILPSRRSALPSSCIRCCSIGSASPRDRSASMRSGRRLKSRCRVWA